MSSDAYHITAPAPAGTGGASCMKMALNDAGISPEEVDYINAHGTSTNREMNLRPKPSKQFSLNMLINFLLVQQNQ